MPDTCQHEETRGDKIGISDHAILRYLERKHKIDIEAIKKEMLPERIKRAMTPCRNEYVVDNMKFILGGHTVVTCIEIKEDKPIERKKQRDKKEHRSNKKLKNDSWHRQKKYTKRIKKMIAGYNG